LAWTDQVYPGAMHTRFEHSLGVMHTATRLYDAIVERSRDVLESELAYNQAGLERDRARVRLAALLHDVGHGPFSHAGEELMPLRSDGSQRYKHEHYSAAIVRRYFREVIEDHPFNTANYAFKAEDVAALLEGSAGARNAAFWRELIVGQMDADRMDYLLRDSLHAGVQYGRFDLERLIRTVEVVRGGDEEGPRLGVREGGWHAAELLVLARYFMFTQVYFHKTRVAFDHHLREALKELLPNARFPSPDEAGLKEYLDWDDWRVLGLIAQGEGGEHGRRLAERDHYREVYHTPEVTRKRDLDQLARARHALGTLLAAEESAAKSWYKVGLEDIPVVSGAKEESVRPLSHYSTVVAQLQPNNQALLYVRPEDADEARRRVAAIARRT
jgi:HD superfamily phosphohydrolase